MTVRSLAINAARMASTAASSAGKPKSINTLPLDLMTRSFMVGPEPVCSAGARVQYPVWPFFAFSNT
jgi:hypothetical protein